ncbi:MAG: PAS domain S-box protein, partial [Candidatus Cloacimonetes bacterium]|nr:PAS domain S-box protein [Candidatus Cloacimonadota bacterium]
MNKTVRVLIVEDDQAHCEAIRRSMLKENDYSLLFSADLKGFFEAVRVESFDIVVADVNLPDGKAYDILEYSKKEKKYPVLVMTAYGDENQAVRLMKEGALDYLVKSASTFSDMPRIIERALREWQLIREKEEIMNRLLLSQKTYKGIIDSIAESIYIQDEDGIFLEVNQAAADAYNCTKEYLIGKSVEFLSAPDLNDFDEIKKAIREAYNGKPVSLEFWGLRSDGSIFPKEVSLSSGEYFGKKATISVSRDITERKQAEEALREKEAMFRSITENAFDMISLLDTNACYLYCNSSYYRILGYSPPELIGKDAISIVHKNDQEIVARLLLEAVTGIRKLSHFSIRLICADGGIKWVDHKATVILNKDGKLERILIMASDISERKKAEEEKKKLESQLLQVQKMESIGRLAGGVAHDLNNMLTPILGYGDLIKNDFDEEDHRAEFMEDLLKAARSARDLVRQLLAFSRKQTMLLKELDLNSALRGFEKLLRRTIHENICIEVKTSSLPLIIQGDLSQLEQIIMNLAVNAQDAMPEGGKLNIETSLTEISEELIIEKLQLTPGEYALLTV